MKLANICLTNRVKNTKVNFLKHAKYYLGIALAILISAAFIIPFVGFKLDFDYTGGTVLTVVSEGVKEDENFNAAKNKIENVLDGYNVSSYQVAETAFGDAITVKFDNKSAETNDAIVKKLNAEFNYNVEDIIQKNYIKTEIVGETASYATKMAAIILAVALVVCAVIMIFRYNLICAISYFITTLLDVLLVIAIAAICRLPINLNITVSAIVVFVISSLTKLILFKNYKFNLKNENLKNNTNAEKVIIADKETFSPLVLITLVCVFALVLLAGLGTLQVRSFAIPTLAGVILSALTTFYASAYLLDCIKIERKQKSKKK